MEIEIVGFNLPGRRFCRPDGSPMDNVHVGVQVGREPAMLLPAGEVDPVWNLDVQVVRRADGFDFRGAAVQGRRGDRFIYLTWGDLGPGDEFERFRRAKLMLDRIEDEVIDRAVVAGQLRALVDLTGEDGGPRCARIDPPAVAWSVPED